MKNRKTKLLSYVVDHHLGSAPNPEDEYCTLVHCKFKGMSGRRNIVELASKVDWVIGTGGLGKDSAGQGRIIYLMRVSRKLSFKRYLSAPRFKGRRDCKDFGEGNKFALVSKRYFLLWKECYRVFGSAQTSRSKAREERAGFPK